MGIGGGVTPAVFVTGARADGHALHCSSSRPWAARRAIRSLRERKARQAVAACRGDRDTNAACGARLGWFDVGSPPPAKILKAFELAAMRALPTRVSPPRRCCTTPLGSGKTMHIFGPFFYRVAPKSSQPVARLLAAGSHSVIVFAHGSKQRRTGSSPHRRRPCSSFVIVPAQTVLCVVVDDEVEFITAQSVVLSEEGVDLVNDAFTPPRIGTLNLHRPMVFICHRHID